MDDQWVNPSESVPDADDERLESLQNAQDALWGQLRVEDDPDRRMALLAEFGENRKAIEQLNESLGVRARPGDAASQLTYRVELVEPADQPAVAADTKGHAGQPDGGTEAPPARPREPQSLPLPAPNPSMGETFAFDDNGELVVSAASKGIVESHEAFLEAERDFEPEGVPPIDQLADEHFSPLYDKRRDEASVELNAPAQQGGPGMPAASSSSRDSGRDASPEPTGGPPRPREARQDDERNPQASGNDRYLNYGAPSGRQPDARQPAPPAPTSQFPIPGPKNVSSPKAKAAQMLQEPDSPHRSLLLLGGLVVVLGFAWFLLSRGDDGNGENLASEVATDASDDEVAGPSADLELGEVVVGLRNIGLDSVLAERRGSTIVLIGTITSEADRADALSLAQAIAPGETIDASELVVVATTSESAPAAAAAAPSRGEAFQNELRRVVASTPIIFDVDQTELTDLHARILNSVASIMLAYPEFETKVVGFADVTGSDEKNAQISLARADNVKAYLVGLGVPPTSLHVEAMGEQTASGSAALANLERRVEFDVILPLTDDSVAVGDAPPIRIAIVAPSASNDLAFSQSMVDAVNALGVERGNVQVDVTDGTFVPDDAAAAIRGYADEDYDLVIAHGSQFGTLLIEIAREYPDVAFAWGTASDTFGLPNVYAYDAAANEGGYVLGTMSTILSSTGVVGVVGPIEVGDAELYINGFRAGALAVKPDATVAVTYTGSFSDLTLAAEAARAHAGAGADVMTGSAQMVVGAVSVAQESGALWFGTQANQTSLAPDLVVASQVYHWETILRQIVADIDAGVLGGESYTANLANGGLVIEFNPDYPLAADVRAQAEETIRAIAAGELQVPR